MADMLARLTELAAYHRKLADDPKVADFLRDVARERAEAQEWALAEIARLKVALAQATTEKRP